MMNNNLNNNDPNYNSQNQFNNPFPIPTNPPYPSGTMLNNNGFIPPVSQNNNPSNINNQVNQSYQTQTLSQGINDTQSVLPNITNPNQNITPSVNQTNSFINNSNNFTTINNSNENIHNGAVPEVNTTNLVNSVPNNNTSYNETSLTDLNIKGNYNNPEKDIHKFSGEIINNQKKKTIPISKELKLVIVIALILFIFILVLPNLFDIVMNIKY